jgi:hypothetical protein
VFWVEPDVTASPAEVAATTRTVCVRARVGACVVLGAVFFFGLPGMSSCRTSRAATSSGSSRSVSR